MASGNVIVTKTVNRTTFEVDKGSYNKTVKQIRQVGKEWEKASDAISSPKKNPAKAYDKSAQQMKLVNKRLADTRMREEKRASDYSIALAKKEARAKESVAKISAARIRQQVKGMTQKNTTMGEMRKFYQQQERDAKKAGRFTRGGGLSTSNLKVSKAYQLPTRGGQGTGMVGNPNNVWSPENVARQNAAMIRGHKQMAANQPDPKLVASQARDAKRSADLAARRDDVMSQQRIRLSSKYGRGYAGSLGKNSGGEGIQDLNRQFKAGTLSSGQYRQSIQALERQFRSAQSSASSFGSVIGDIRGAVMGGAAAYGAVAAGKSVIEQGQFFQGLEATMLMVSDSSDEAGKRIGFVRDQSYRLGLSLKEASQGYVQMSIAANGVISKQENDDLFKGFSEYSTALQVDPVRYQRGITAIQQMMGKGQIMAEELKQQLAEGIPGSLQVFLKATQEAFGDASIDVTKMMDMMSKGQLTAAKVMPFVAKYFAEAARKGGALDKALDSNRVSMQRLQQTWVNFQNSIFEGGFGDQMTRIFRDLATILSSNGELATNLGKFFGNVIEGFWDMTLEIHDDFVLIDRVFGYYLEKLGVKGDLLRDIFDWGSYALGIGIFIKSITSILGILTKIAGLRGAIVAIRGALGGDLAAAGGVGKGSGGVAGGAAAAGAGDFVGPPKPGGKLGGLLESWKGLGKIAKIGVLAEAYAAGDMFYDQFLKRGDDKLKDAGIADPDASAKKYGLPKPIGFLDVVDSWFNSPRSLDSPTINTGSMSPSAPSSFQGAPFLAPPTKVEGQVTIKIDAGDLKGMVKGIVDENERFNLNMLMQGGSTG